MLNVNRRFIFKFFAVIIAAVFFLSLVISMLSGFAASARNDSSENFMAELTCVSKTASMSAPPDIERTGSFQSFSIIATGSNDRGNKTDVYAAVCNLAYNFGSHYGRMFCSMPVVRYVTDIAVNKTIMLC